MYLEEKYGNRRKDLTADIEAKIQSAKGKRHLKVNIFLNFLF